MAPSRSRTGSDVSSTQSIGSFTLGGGFTSRAQTTHWGIGWGANAFNEAAGCRGIKVVTGANATSRWARRAGCLGTGTQRQGVAPRRGRRRQDVGQGPFVPGLIADQAVPALDPTDPVGPDPSGAAIDLEVVGAAIHHMDPLGRRGRRADLLDQLAPHGRFAVAPLLLGQRLPLGSGPAMEQDLPGQAHHPLVAGVHHQRRVDQEPAARAAADRPQARGLAFRPVVDLGGVVDDQEPAPVGLLRA